MCLKVGDPRCRPKVGRSQRPPLDEVGMGIGPRVHFVGDSIALLNDEVQSRFEQGLKYCHGVSMKVKMHFSLS